jgi:hypothetical protein
MKKTYLFLVSLICLVFLFFACQKHPDNLSNPDKSIIEDARAYFESNYGQKTMQTTAETNSSANSQSLAKTALWDKAYIVQLSSGPAAVVPLKFDSKAFFNTNLDPSRMYDRDNTSFLVVSRDIKNKYNAEVIRISPDSSSGKQAGFSGIINTEDWEGQKLNEYRFTKHGIQKMQMDRIRQPASADSVKANAETVNISQAIETCYSQVTYTYSVDDPDNGIYSYEDLGCTTYFIDLPAGSTEPGGVSGADLSRIGASTGSASTGSLGNNIVTDRGNNIIKDINQYIKCFNNTAGSGYSVVLFVDQPLSGSRETYSSAGDGDPGFTVGHAFLVFQENQGGVVTRRAMGLYPSTNVTPFNPVSKGNMNDDEGHSFDIALSVSLGGQQFMEILNFCANGNNINYDMNSNNCVTWALSSLSAGGINIATKAGRWPFGSGDDPGDLGEDIRAMQLAPNMTRTNSGGDAPSNIGTCP